MIKNFIARNKSVFFIGFTTLAIFLVIIAISEVKRMGNKNYGPELIKVEESTESTNSALANMRVANVDDFILEGSESSYSVLSEDQYAQTDSKYSTMRIEYTDNGFSPENSKAILNQKVKWVNETNQNIYIKQENAFFREFKNPIIVPANSTMEFRMYREGVWSYRELTTEHFGSITIIKP